MEINKIKSSLLVIVLFQIFIGMLAYANICENSSLLNTKPVYTYTGIYKNNAWGYSIEIPQGLIGGLYQDPNAPQHGIDVIISKHPYSCVYFYGEANSLENEKGKPLSAKEYSIHRISAIKEYAKYILSSDVRKAKLGTYDGYIWSVRYVCAKNKEVHVYEGVVAIPKERALVYEVALETTEGRYKKDHSILKKFTRTFRLIQWK